MSESQPNTIFGIYPGSVPKSCEDFWNGREIEFERILIGKSTRRFNGHAVLSIGHRWRGCINWLFLNTKSYDELQIVVKSCEELPWVAMSCTNTTQKIPHVYRHSRRITWTSVEIVSHQIPRTNEFPPMASSVIPLFMVQSLKQYHSLEQTHTSTHTSTHTHSHQNSSIVHYEAPTRNSLNLFEITERGQAYWKRSW